MFISFHVKNTCLHPLMSPFVINFQQWVQFTLKNGNLTKQAAGLSLWLPKALKSAIKWAFITTNHFMGKQTGVVGVVYDNREVEETKARNHSSPANSSCCYIVTDTSSFFLSFLGKEIYIHDDFDDNDDEKEWKRVTMELDPCEVSSYTIHWCVYKYTCVWVIK